MSYEYSAEKVNWAAQYFDEFADQEWHRLSRTPADRISFEVHAHYLRTNIKPGSRVLEIGAGPGKFTQVLAELSSTVVVSDVSQVQLDLHKKYSKEHGFDSCVESWELLDVTDLSSHGDATFDAVVVYGGPLSYVFEDAGKALQECVRVCRPGGPVLTSVMSMWGTVHRSLKGVLAIPPANNQKIVASGNVTKENFAPVHHQCHMFRSAELCELATQSGLTIKHLSASACLSIGWDHEVWGESETQEAWDELLRMELEATAQAGCQDMGTHIILVGVKS